MSKPLSQSERAQIVRLREKGTTYQHISEVVGCSLRSVQRIYKQYQTGGLESLQTQYHRSGRKALYNSQTWQRVKQVRDGEQGAPYVRSVLLERHKDLPIPNERTIQRYWSKVGTNRPKGRAKQQSTWTSQAGHTYQIDGKDQICLKTGQMVSWMKVADEASGTDLSTQLFFH